MEATVVSKQCKECGDTYPLSGFPKNREMRDGHINTCKPCTAVYNAAYHRRRPEQARTYAREGARRRRVALRAVHAEARDRPCVDCGVQYPRPVMELDHVRGEKLFTPSQFMGKGCAGNEAILRAEIAKCDVRCANCHRLRHWREKNC